MAWTSRRTKHGALLDSEILAEVYAELMGGRQARLALDPAASETVNAPARRAREAARALPQQLTEAELLAHTHFVATLGKIRPVAALSSCCSARNRGERSPYRAELKRIYNYLGEFRNKCGNPTFFVNDETRSVK